MPKPKSESLLLVELEATFHNRDPGPAGAYDYLCAVYAIVTRNKNSRAFRQLVDAKLTRSPSTDDLFAHVIEVTSSYSPKTRSKYAKMLRLLHEHRVPRKGMRKIVMQHGGFNGTIDALTSAQ